VRDPVREAQAFYGDKAEAYRASAAHGNAADLARMLALLGDVRGARAVDVGAGGGHTALALARAGARVVAMDVTRAMLVATADGAREAEVDLDVALGDASALPFATGSLDVAATRIATHHFADLGRFVEEAYRVLGPGGRFYAFDLASPPEAGAAATVNRIETLRDPSHVWSWSRAAWAGALEAAGFKAQTLSDGASELDLEAWLARARMPAGREAEVRALLADHPPESLGGYGVVAPGRIRLLRVETLAVKPQG